MTKDVKYVGIRKDLFDEIEEYAKLNGLKTSRLINNLLKERFMVEKYGESPFDAFAKKIRMEDTPAEIQKVVNDNFWEMLDNDSKAETLNAPSHDLSVPKEDVPAVEMVTPTGSLLSVNEIIPVMEEEMPSGILLSAFSDTVIEQTPESQAIIDEHDRLLREKNNKPRKRRLK